MTTPSRTPLARGNVDGSPRVDGTGLVVDPAAPIPQMVFDALLATSVVGS